MILSIACRARHHVTSSVLMAPESSRCLTCQARAFGSDRRRFGLSIFRWRRAQAVDLVLDVGKARPQSIRGARRRRDHAVDVIAQPAKIGIDAGNGGERFFRAFHRADDGLDRGVNLRRQYGLMRRGRLRCGMAGAGSLRREESGWGWLSGRLNLRWADSRRRRRSLLRKSALMPDQGQQDKNRARQFQLAQRITPRVKSKFGDRNGPRVARKYGISPHQAPRPIAPAVILRDHGRNRRFCARVPRKCRRPLSNPRRRRARPPSPIRSGSSARVCASGQCPRSRQED